MYESCIYLIITLASLSVLKLLWKIIELTCHEIEITSERLILSNGVFSKQKKSIELYRVKDMTYFKSLLWRFLGLHNISLITSDPDLSDITLEALPDQNDIYDQLRKSVDLMRTSKGVHEIDNR